MEAVAREEIARLRSVEITPSGMMPGNGTQNYILRESKSLARPAACATARKRCPTELGEVEDDEVVFCRHEVTRMEYMALSLSSPDGTEDGQLSDSSRQLSVRPHLVRQRGIFCPSYMNSVWC